MTKRRIKRVAPLQAGKMLGVLYTCMGLIFLPFFMLAAAAGAFVPHTQSASTSAPPAAVIAGFIMGMGIFMPIIYGVMGFFVGIIGAAIYNLIARWIGGIEVEVEKRFVPIRDERFGAPGGRILRSDRSGVLLKSRVQAQ